MAARSSALVYPRSASVQRSDESWVATVACCKLSSGFGQLRAESLRGRERTRRRVVGPLEITDEDQTGCGPCADETGDAVVTAEARRQQ